jgi:hypothetical protein
LFCTIISILALILTVEYHFRGGKLTCYCPNPSDLAGAGILALPMPSKLTQAVRDDIQLQLQASTRPDVIATAYLISERQV